MAMYLDGQAVKIIERSKNLIPFDYADRGKTSGGITYTVNNDGSVTLNGLSTAPSEIVLTYGVDLPKGVYTYKLNLSHYVANIYGYIACILDGAYVAFPNKITVSSDELTRTFEITQEMIDAGYKIRLNIYVQVAGVQVENLIIKPMLNEGRTPAPYGKKDSIIPFRIRSGVNMGRNPKNLIPFPYVFVGNPIEKVQTKNGVTFTLNDDGTVTANGTATAQIVYYIFHEVDGDAPIPIKAGKYSFSDGVANETWDTHLLTGNYIKENGNEEYFSIGTQTLENGRLRGLYILIREGVTLNNATFKPMLNEGTKALPYFYYD